ncbi:MAG: ABC transporter ATP-binding protein/permease [Oscillospiraceae bacterium]|nr:ABC transporter ATP-binding protein/permease [Oscillospiraceae bacterium]
MQKLRAHYKKVFISFNYLSRILNILASGGRIYLVLIFLLAVLFGVLPSISVLVMQAIINTLQTAEQSFQYIIILIAVYIGIDLFMGIAGVLSGYIESVLKMKSGITLKMSLLEKVKELSLKDFENTETYNLIQRAMGTSIENLFSFFKSFVYVLQSFISLIMFSLILLSWHWWLLPIIVFVPMIGTFIATHYGKKQFLIQKERAGDARKQWYYEFLLTNDIAFKEIKTFNLGDHFRNKYKQLSLIFLKQDRQLLKRRTVAQSFLLIIDQVIIAVLFAFIILQAFMGQILLGDLIAYTRSMSNIKSSTQALSSHVSAIYQNILNISLYFDFIDMKSVTEENIEEQPLTVIPSIEIKNLSYKYKGNDSYALKNINLKIERGNLIAFIGRNGSGKTTLVKILSALYNDYQGDVYFGKQNLRNLNTEELRKKVGILFQDFMKYELSAKENVAFGQLEKIDNNSEILEALIKTGMQEKIADLESQLGFWFDDGVQLSGGEWLRIALSRAFIRDAELFLLDEPNSALDSVSERRVLKSFKELTSDKIGIIVSHRIASIKNIVDQIVVFDDGCIQACGTHDELLKTSEIYRKLYEQENGIN